MEQQLFPCPDGRLDEGGDGLGAFSRKCRVEYLSRGEEDLGIGRQSEGGEEGFGVVGGKDGGDAQAGAEGFGEEDGPLDSGQRAAAGGGEGLAQLLEMLVLFALYVADRHGWIVRREAERGGAHPSRKNKNAAKVGHPGTRP